MQMPNHGSFSQSWDSCFSGYASDDPFGQQVVELSTLVGYGLRGPGMVSDDELSNLDHDDYFVVVYYQCGEYWYPFLVTSRMGGEQGSLSATEISSLIGTVPSPSLEDLCSKGLWPLYRN